MNDDSDTLNQLVDTDEAAAILGWAPGYVRRLFAEGKLPGRKFGKGWATTRQAVEDYKQQRAKENDMDDQQDLRAQQIYRMSKAQYIAEYLDPMHAVIDYDDPEQYADDTLDQWPEEDAPLASRQDLIDYWHEQTGE